MKSQQAGQDAITKSSFNNLNSLEKQSQDLNKIISFQPSTFTHTNNQQHLIDQDFKQFQQDFQPTILANIGCDQIKKNYFKKYDSQNFRNVNLRLKLLQDSQSLVNLFKQFKQFYIPLHCCPANKKQEEEQKINEIRYKKCIRKHLKRQFEMIQGQILVSLYKGQQKTQQNKIQKQSTQNKSQQNTDANNTVINDNKNKINIFQKQQIQISNDQYQNINQKYFQSYFQSSDTNKEQQKTIKKQSTSKITKNIIVRGEKMVNQQKDKYRCELKKIQ